MSKTYDEGGATANEALALLGPEELAALSDPEYSDEEQKRLAELAAEAEESGDNDDEAADDDDDDASDATGDAHSTDDAAADPQADASTQVQQKDEPEPKPPRVEPGPVQAYRADLPADFDQRMGEATAARDALWTKFEDGELTRAELQASLAKAEADIVALERMRTKAEVSAEMAQQAAANQYKAAIDKFLDDQRAAGFDYSKNGAAWDDLTAFVGVLERKPENANRDMAWLLAEGHKRVAALYDIPVVGKKSGTADADKAKADALARRRQDTSAAPKTLSGLPAGRDGVADTRGDEFADLDALQGDEYTDALARLSPRDRERYLAGASSQ